MKCGPLRCLSRVYLFITTSDYIGKRYPTHVAIHTEKVERGTLYGRGLHCVFIRMISIVAVSYLLSQKVPHTSVINNFVRIL